MKKIIAREFLWLLVNLVLAAPLAFFFLGALDLIAEGDVFTENEKNFIAQLYLLAYVFNFIGLYVVRFIVLAIQTLTAKEEKSKK
jgi:hypothetical protein